ncbi:hypothetical protein JOJ88_003155 [Pantoea cypripedii]|nr:hypothetical protein [Pantoea cypripedii]
MIHVTLITLIKTKVLTLFLPGFQCLQENIMICELRHLIFLLPFFSIFSFQYACY